MKRFMICMLSLFFIFALMGCRDTKNNKEVSLELQEYIVTLKLGDQKQITAIVDPIDTVIKWTSSDLAIATVSNDGLIKAIGIGVATVHVQAGIQIQKVEVHVVEEITDPVALEVIGLESGLFVGDYLQLTAIVTPSNAIQSVSWLSLNEDVAKVDHTGKVLAVGAGDVTIVVSSTVKPTLIERVTIEVEVKLTDEEKRHQAIMAIMSTLTIEEKIGQMFMVGFEGTTVPNSLKQAVENKRFGNFIYFGANVSDARKVSAMSADLQNQVMNEIGIPAFISMDHEGGVVVRFAGEATHFIGNMGLVAIANSEHAYQVGKYSGLELSHYGVNYNLAPELDVNNNPSNPVIGIRSFSENPQVVSEYGLKMLQGMKDSKILATVKHFPGHGDTMVDSHYGLPLIPHNKQRLYEVELAPFIDAIEAGVDSIMTAHIIFSAFDSEYPATLSHKVLTGLLREELGYEGIIMTDEMRMNAIQNNFGKAEAAVMAIQAGVDMLLYADSTSTSLVAYEAILEAVQNKTISEERINASVYRILDKKMKYDLFDENQTNQHLEEKDFVFHNSFNHDLIEKSITLAKGDIEWFKKERSTLLISSKSTRHILVPGYTINSDNNSLAYVGKEYLKSRGVTRVDSYVIETTLSAIEINNIITQARGYDQVIVAIENATLSQTQLVNRLGQEDFDLLAVALRNPYDYLSYNYVDHYVCTYGYFAGTVQAVMDLLLGDYDPTGVLPVKVSGLN